MKPGKKELESLGRIIEAKVHIQMIGRSIQALESGAETLVQDGVEIVRPLDKNRVVALSKALDARFRLLAKVLPDRKAMEVDLGEQTLGAVREYSNVERAARVAYLLERLREGGVRPVAPGRDTDMDAAPGPTERCTTFLS